MIFKDIGEAIASIQALQRFYSIVQIRSVEHSQIFYKGSGRNEGICSKELIPFTGTFQSQVTIDGDNNNVIVTTSIPITICGQSFSLELIQQGINYREDMQKVSLGSKNMLSYMCTLAITDSLTNLYNHRYIYEQLPIDMADAFIQNKPISIIYADIDSFKEINDTYGHIIGDYLLKEVSYIFLQVIQSKTAWIARYGGDEFLISLPFEDGTLATNIAYQIRKKIENKEFILDSCTTKITCSFGVLTLYKENHILSVDEVIKLVDCKLYHAKNSGKNKVVV